MLRTKAVLKCRTAVAIKGEIMGILIENLSFHYTGTPVLEQVNLEVKDGDYVILTGENGSGKSTFLKLLLGELKAQEGSITVNGKAVQRNVGVSIPLRPPFRRHGVCSMRAAQLRYLIFRLPSRKFLTFISPRRTAITPCLWSEAVRVAGLQRPTPERYLP